MTESTTLVERVYASVKEDILLGRMSPGDRIRLADMAKDRNVSLSVVREAVTRLGSERLVEAKPQHGFRVRSLSVPDLEDLTRVRIDIESLALRDAVAKGDPEWEAELVAAHYRLTSSERTTRRRNQGPNYAWMAAHSAFHAAMAEACSSPILKELRQQLFDESEVYRYWSAPLARERSRDAASEHRALLDAALAHDVRLTVRLMRAHIQLTTDLLLEQDRD